MKNNNPIVLLLVAAVIVVLIFAMKGKGGNETNGVTGVTGASDYDKIETVRQAVEQLAGTSAVKSLGTDQGQWYIFDLRLIYQKDGEFYTKLAEKLGENFDSKLSNGDYLFIGVYPLRGSYRVYAGDPANENNMLYPEWKYSKLEKK
ncbi:MAG: hypothetical protein J6N53_17030 [Lachnospiraceae bacterium]|nr:hypothetical protein [Lachnospiraceae bacterium]